EEHLDTHGSGEGGAGTQGRVCVCVCVCVCMCVCVCVCVRETRAPSYTSPWRCWSWDSVKHRCVCVCVCVCVCSARPFFYSLFSLLEKLCVCVFADFVSYEPHKDFFVMGSYQNK